MGTQVAAKLRSSELPVSEGRDMLLWRGGALGISTYTGGARGPTESSGPHQARLILYDGNGDGVVRGNL